LVVIKKIKDNQNKMNNLKQIQINFYYKQANSQLIKIFQQNSHLQKKILKKYLNIKKVKVISINKIMIHKNSLKILLSINKKIIMMMMILN